MNELSFEHINALFNIIGTIAVTLTVVYLAIQVKRSTKATYSHTYYFAIQAMGDMTAIFGETKDKSRVLPV